MTTKTAAQIEIQFNNMFGRGWKSALSVALDYSSPHALSTQFTKGKVSTLITVTAEMMVTVPKSNWPPRFSKMRHMAIMKEKKDRK